METKPKREGEQFDDDLKNDEGEALGTWDEVQSFLNSEYQTSLRTSCRKPDSPRDYKEAGG